MQRLDFLGHVIELMSKVLGGTSMAEGGFLIKFDAKKAKPQRCYAVAFDYDDWSYVINNQPKTAMPKGTQKIIIEIERS